MIAMVAILTLLVPAMAVAQEIEMRGTVVTDSTMYDYTSFGGFWYALDDNESSEELYVNVSGRTILEGELVYACVPADISYENPALGNYTMIGFMAERYIAVDGKADTLAKLLVEWDNDVTMVDMGESLVFPERYELVIAQIDINGDKVVLDLYKDGDKIDTEIVISGDTYVYDDDDDAIVFSCMVDTVFRGTESDVAGINYVFLRSENVMDIDSGDNFGIMEVVGTSGAIKLVNDADVTLGEGDTVDIMDGMYFVVADSNDLRYYLAKEIVVTCPECPACEGCEDCEVCVEPTPCPTTTPCEVCPPCAPVATPTPDDPNDSAGFAVMLGLLAIGAGFVILRR